MFWGVFYRKEQGLNPTGILSHKAKASGLSSVSELLQVEGDDSFAYSKKAKLLFHFSIFKFCVCVCVIYADLVILFMQEDVAVEGRSGQQ